MIAYQSKAFVVGTPLRSFSIAGPHTPFGRPVQIANRFRPDKSGLLSHVAGCFLAGSNPSGRIEVALADDHNNSVGQIVDVIVLDQVTPYQYPWHWLSGTSKLKPRLSNTKDYWIVGRHHDPTVLANWALSQSSGRCQYIGNVSNWTDSSNQIQVHFAIHIESHKSKMIRRNNLRKVR